VSFTPSLGMDEYIDGEVTFDNNNSVLYSVLDPTKTTYFESDFNKVTISSTVKVKNPEDLVSTNTLILGIFTTTIENFNPFACILSGSQVSLADGSTKLIDDVTTSDKLMTFNFYEGKLDGNFPMYVMKHEDVLSSVITITLDNGTVIEMCDWQQFFDMDSKSYFDINAENYKDSMGRNIMFIDDGVVSSSRIRDASLEVRHCTSYEIFTEYNKNFVANGVLTVEPETYLEGVYTIGDDLKINYDQYLRDVESYGRYTYEEFSDIMTEHQFNVLNIADKKIAVGKGIVDEKWLFDLYRQWMPLYN